MVPLPPYGPAITQAAQSGDLAQMQATANAARLSIAQCGGEQLKLAEGTGTGEATVTFTACSAEDLPEVAAALKALEAAIAKAEAAQQQSS